MSAAAIQRVATHAKPLGGLRHVARAVLDRPQQRLPVRVGGRRARLKVDCGVRHFVSMNFVAPNLAAPNLAASNFTASNFTASNFAGQVAELHDATIADGERGANHVAQLADVAWPAIREQLLKCVDFDRCGTAVVRLGCEKLANETLLVG